MGIKRTQVRLLPNFERLELRWVLADDLAPLLDINQTPFGSISPAKNGTAVGPTLYFTMQTRSTGDGLWKTDGSPDGTVFVKDTTPGTFSSDLTSLTNVNGTLFFQSGLELWKSSGTEAGTQLVSDVRVTGLAPGDGALTNVNGTLFFRGTDAVNAMNFEKRWDGCRHSQGQQHTPRHQVAASCSN